MDPTCSFLRKTTESKFGISSASLGTHECTLIQSRVNRIAQDEIKGAYIGLSAFQMSNLRSEFGVITIKDPETSRVMAVKVYNAWGADCSANSEEIVISKLVSETLNLKLGQTVEIERKMDAKGAIKWGCAQNKNNLF